jgi:hypothetical protein
MRKIVAFVLTAVILLCLASCSIPVLNIALDQYSVELNVGDSVELKASVSPSFASIEDIKWNSSDDSVATVTDGKVTAKGVGTAEITVYANGGKTASCLVTVKACPHVYGEWTVLKEAICNQSGSMTRECRICGETESITYVDYDNHKFVNGSCVNCGKTLSSGNNDPEKEEDDDVVDTPIIDWEAD